MKTIPILYSNDIGASIAFYEELGFAIDAKHSAHGYLIVEYGKIEIHFQFSDTLNPKTNEGACFIRYDDPDELWGKFSRAHLKSAGIPRIDKIENKPWGMREFAIIDNAGNLLRIGGVNA